MKNDERRNECLSRPLAARSMLTENQKGVSEIVNRMNMQLELGSMTLTN